MQEEKKKKKTLLPWKQLDNEQSWKHNIHEFLLWRRSNDWERFLKDTLVSYWKWMFHISLEGKTANLQTKFLHVSIMQTYFLLFFLNHTSKKFSFFRLLVLIPHFSSHIHLQADWMLGVQNVDIRNDWLQWSYEQDLQSLGTCIGKNG